MYNVGNRNDAYILFIYNRSIKVRRGRTIKFEFTKFNIHQYAGTECRNYILFKNGESMESPFLGQGKYCGTSIPSITKTSSNRAFVGESVV